MENYECIQPNTTIVCQYGIEIHRPANGNLVVVVTELPGNRGMSVTNAIGWLLPKIAEEYGLDRESVIWVEHYPKVEDRQGEPAWMGEETFDLVLIHSERGQRNYLRTPSWQRLLGLQYQKLINTGILSKNIHRP